jgi:putative molybdopterin biosynthesis protein
MVKKANPEQILSIQDLTRCRYVNRQRGAGTRLLFDYQLKEAGISPAQINGYTREAANHMAVAAAVKGEGSDAGLGVLSAAIAMDLDFIPIGEEEYDFAVPARFMDLPQIQAFIQVLKERALQEKISALGGYTLNNCGKTISL